MAHARAAIRQAAVALLAAGGTAAGTRVHDHPSDPRRVFPSLVVEDAGEQQSAVTLHANAGRVIQRNFALIVSAELQQVSGYAVARDELLGQVEALLAAAQIPGVKSITPAGYQPDADYTGERPIVVGRQRFDVRYYTPQGSPATTL